MESIVDPDQMAPSVTNDLDQQWFQNMLYPGSAKILQKLSIYNNLYPINN